MTQWRIQSELSSSKPYAKSSHDAEAEDQGTRGFMTNIQKLHGSGRQSSAAEAEQGPEVGVLANSCTLTVHIIWVGCNTPKIHKITP